MIGKVIAVSIIPVHNGSGSSIKNGNKPLIPIAAIEIIIIMLNGRSIFDLKVTMNPLFSDSNYHCTEANKKSHTLGLGMAL